MTRLCGAAAGVTAAPFKLSFSLAGGAFGNPVRPPLVLRGRSEEIVPLLAFRRRLSDALSAAGLAPEPVADFTPHVTLLYGDRAVAQREVDPVDWTVRDFVLIRSMVGLGRHVELGRWALPG